ncbi:META domain-containing protein [Rubidibacter lacunae]|nr:META domain-containing protein [Rubidibacter lacunae]
MVLFATLGIAGTVACNRTPPPEPTEKSSPAEPADAAIAPVEPPEDAQTDASIVYNQTAEGIPVTTLYPETMTVTSNRSGDGIEIFFTFKPQGNALDNAEVGIFLPEGAATADEIEALVRGPNGLLDSNGWTPTGEGDLAEFPYDWVEMAIAFNTEREESGYVLLGQAEGQAIQAILRYPTAMPDAYWPAARAILDNLEFGPTFLGAEASEQSAMAIVALADTEWRLVEIQSMSEEIGTIRPDDPSLYIMRLNADGTVNMRLNCNRANGTWSAEPSDDDSNGRFQFGPLATTKALCPAPSLDERIAADAGYIRSYLLKEGKLYLSLFADGGIYAWEPIDVVRFQTEPDAQLEAAILEVSPDYITEIGEFGSGPARYIYSRGDLNGDGIDETLVLLMGPFFCGTGGCNLLLFTEADGEYTLVNNFPISRAPLIVSAEKTEGWNDLIRLESGGGVEPAYIRHTFDGDRYVEQERLPVDPAPEGKQYLAGDVTFNNGIPLKPQNRSN